MSRHSHAAGELTLPGRYLSAEFFPLIETLEGAAGIRGGLVHRRRTPSTNDSGGFTLPTLSGLSDCTRAASQTFAGQLHLRMLKTVVLVAVLPVASGDARGQQVLDLLHRHSRFPN